MFLRNGKRFNIDAAHVIGDVQFPAGYFNNPEAREQMGIVEGEEQPRPDDRFYIVTDNGDGTYSAEPKDLSGLKAMRVAEVKAQAAAFLSGSDWRVIRAAEGIKPCDQATLDYRASVRAASDAAEAAILACKNVETLAALASNWPPVVA